MQYLELCALESDSLFELVFSYSSFCPFLHSLASWTKSSLTILRITPTVYQIVSSKRVGSLWLSEKVITVKYCCTNCQCRRILPLTKRIIQQSTSGYLAFTIYVIVLVLHCLLETGSYILTSLFWFMTD